MASITTQQSNLKSCYHLRRVANGMTSKHEGDETQVNKIGMEGACLAHFRYEQQIIAIL